MCIKLERRFETDEIHSAKWDLPPSHRFHIGPYRLAVAAEQIDDGFRETVGHRDGIAWSGLDTGVPVAHVGSDGSVE